MNAKCKPAREALGTRAIEWGVVSQTAGFTLVSAGWGLILKFIIVPSTFERRIPLKEELKLFMLPNCPYCLEVFGFIEELKRENPEYTDIKLVVVDEKAEAELAARFNYYYVPTFYFGSVKLHEGAATKEKIAKVFEHYLTS